MVKLADSLDWTEMEIRPEEIRASKLKNAAGRPPHMRALLGAMVLRVTRWSPDHNTLHDFIELMGEEGARFINEYAVEWAVEEKLADPSVVVG